MNNDVLAQAHRRPDALERGPAHAQPARVRLRGRAAAAAARCCCSRASAATRPSARTPIVTLFLVVGPVPRLLQRALAVRQPPRRARAQAHAHRRGARRRADRQHRAPGRGERAGARRRSRSRSRWPSTSRCRSTRCSTPRGAVLVGHHVHRVRLLDRRVDPERRGGAADQHADHPPRLPRPARLTAIPDLSDTIRDLVSLHAGRRDVRPRAGRLVRLRRPGGRGSRR